MPASRQPHRELSELADFTVDRDQATVLLGYDIEADRQAEPCPFSGRLRREEGLEQLLSVFGRNTHAVVPYPDLNRVTDLARRDLQDRTKCAIPIAPPLVGGIEAVADEVQ